MRAQLQTSKPDAGVDCSGDDARCRARRADGTGVCRSHLTEYFINQILKVNSPTNCQPIPLYAQFTLEIVNLEPVTPGGTCQGPALFLLFGRASLAGPSVLERKS